MRTMIQQPYRGPSALYSWSVYLFLLLYALTIHVYLEAADLFRGIWQKGSVHRRPITEMH